MFRASAAASTPVVRVVASAIVAAVAFVATPATASATESDTVTDVRVFEVQEATQLGIPTPAAAPAASATPKRIIANFTARSLAAIRATRSASLFRWGTPAYAKWYAKSHIAKKYAWGATQFGCLVSLWNRESHWGFRSHNRGGGTYGIPQTNKRTIVAFGTTFATYMKTPELQVQVGAKYVNYRYGSPCKAYAFAKRHGWY